MTKIAIIGAGTMGSGIAQVAAQAGYDVLMYDVKDEFVQRGMGTIKSALASRVEKGKMEAGEMDAILGRVATTTKRDDAVGGGAGIVIEAAPEDLELKREIFSALSAGC